MFVSDRTAKDNREFFQMTATVGAQHRLFADSRQWDMSPDWGSSFPAAGCTISGTINADSIGGTPRRDVIRGPRRRTPISRAARSPAPRAPITYAGRPAPT